MGIDLVLLPIDVDGAENGTLAPPEQPWGYGYSHTRLPVPRSQGTWPAVQRAAEPMGDMVFASIEGDMSAHSSGKSEYGTTLDAYAAPLTFVRARKLAGLLCRCRIDQGPEADGRLAAIVAYLRALPPRTRVVLYWC